MAAKTLLILAEGFEEIEAVTIIDVLRRAEIEVAVAGLDARVICGAHGLKVETDILLNEFDGNADAIILPGGLPGSDNLAKSEKVRELILDFHKNNKIVAAICAAPALALSPTGILEGKSATCYPGCEGNFGPQVKIQKDQAVVQDANIITSRGPGTAFAFAFALVSQLKSKETVDTLKSAMLV